MLENILKKQTWIELLLSSHKPVLLYGSGNGADKISARLGEYGIKIDGVAVSDGFTAGKTVYGHKTVTMSEAERLFGDFNCVLCFGTDEKETEYVRSLSHRHTVICPDAPVFGDEWQTKELMISEREEIERVYSMLADSLSERLFCENLSFSITGDMRDLNWLDSDISFPDEYYSHKKIHIDVGAFDGDTAVEYASFSKNNSGIIALEPDSSSFLKLTQNTSHIKNIQCINSAVGNYCGESGFDAKHSRGSSAAKGFGTEMLTIDSLTDRTYAFKGGKSVGSIKIDAEGLDTEAIEGAVNTVCEEMPVIAVSVYHRAGDIWRIPLYLHRLCGKYRFYIRRKPRLLPAWDTLAIAVRNDRGDDGTST